MDYPYNGNLSLGTLRVQARLRELADTQKRVLRGIGHRPEHSRVRRARQSRFSWLLRRRHITGHRIASRGLIAFWWRIWLHTPVLSGRICAIETGFDGPELSGKVPEP